MTAQHVRATQRRKREFANQLDYEVLLVIATDTGNNNEPATTSYRGIAERVACHYNTVSGHISNLEAGGWIKVVKSGKYHQYQLADSLSQFDAANCDNQENIVTGDYDNNGTLSHAPTGNYDNSETLSQRLSQVEQQLSQLGQQLSQLTEQLSQLGGQIVTSDQSTNVTKDSEVREERREEKRRNIYIAPEVQKFITVTAEISKTPYWVRTEDEYIDAAYCLIGYEATPERVLEFGQWWETYGFYSGKPALKSILDNWKMFADGVIPVKAAAPNGTRATAADSYKEAFGI